MEPSSTRASLLSRVRNPADNGAWTQFVERYGDLILRYALGRGLQYCDAEDVRQVVLLYLSRSLREFRYSPERGRFRDYLSMTARHAVNRFLSSPRTHERCLSMDVIGDTPADGDPRDALWEREWVDHHYRLALQAVRADVEPRSLEVFERLRAGMSVADAATAFGMSEDAVQKIRQRVRDWLREQVAMQVGEEDAPDG